MNLRVHPQQADASASVSSASPDCDSLAFAAQSWPNRVSGEVCTAVLQISGMPRCLRPAIERAMARCIRSESEFIVPGDDPLTAQWCTRWCRDADWDPVSGKTLGGTARGVGIGCRQVLTGTPSELEALGRAVEMLAGEYGFRAVVKRAA